MVVCVSLSHSNRGCVCACACSCVCVCVCVCAARTCLSLIQTEAITWLIALLRERSGVEGRSEFTLMWGATIEHIQHSLGRSNLGLGSV